MNEIPMEAGRHAFGADAANYDNARPEYPARVFEVLRERCGLGPGTRTFEIGAGTGLATRSLIEAGASPLVAIEPDPRLAARLAERAPGVRIVNAAFEDAVVEGPFDLGTAATSFHWMEQRPALAKVAGLLRPGGWWAMWWNVFGDPERTDAFHDATLGLLTSTPTSPAVNSNWNRPLDREARFADLQADGLYEDIAVETLSWTLVLDASQVRALYATYSQFSVLEETERNRVLDGLAEIAAKEFAGRVERNMLTPIYTARRR